MKSYLLGYTKSTSGGAIVLKKGEKHLLIKLEMDIDL